MRVITEQDVRSIYTMDQCMESVEKALKLQQCGNVTAPVRTAINVEKGTMLYMPSYVEDINYLGIKIVSVFPENKKIGGKTIQGIFLLTNAESGEHLSLIDASWLTVMRTGALSGIATKYLARDNANTCLVIGCGLQAIGQIQAVLKVRPIKKILLYNQTKAKAVKLKNYIKENFKWIGDIGILEDPNEGVPYADVIICSTNSFTPVFDGTLLQAGTHINGIGSFQPNMQEVDTVALLKSDKVVVDTIEGALHEAGDLLIPTEQNKWSFNQLHGELGEITLGNLAGREREEEITFFKSVGFSMLDIVCAASIYEEALHTDVGLDISTQAYSIESR
ncbi:ornithine cyclodeaminase family protein [Fictibacillus sp. B-59209]|uniref:ornithine cyclodeaminase family protein n=1 Tax=Fictibacillus sp. B-59209 TaxID=3024873 RepID=UPI002E218AEA|nr:ornithine cyclodeaminase family protein [Fictibacillus sp. B-59209]